MEYRSEQCRDLISTPPMACPWSPTGFGIGQLIPSLSITMASGDSGRCKLGLRQLRSAHHIVLL
jgi:hypothetical protein